MRKCMLFLLIAVMLCPLAASGAEAPRYLAVTFAGCPVEENTAHLLEGLESRGVRGTFFLAAKDCPRSGLLLEQGQELGILSDAVPALSRREIAAQITDIRSELPGRTRVRFLLHRGADTVGFRQVAEALGLVILEPSTQWERAGDGDILLLDGRLPVEEILYQIDCLQRREFTLVTVSELVRLRGVFLHAGDCRSGFPRRDDA